MRRRSPRRATTAALTEPRRMAAQRARMKRMRKRKMEARAVMPPPMKATRKATLRITCPKKKKRTSLPLRKRSSSLIEAEGDLDVRGAHEAAPRNPSQLASSKPSQ